MLDSRILLLTVSVGMGIFATVIYVWSSIRLLRAKRTLRKEVDVIRQEIAEVVKPYKCGWCSGIVHVYELSDYTISGDGVYLFSKDGCSRCIRYVEETRTYYGRNGISIQDFDRFMRKEYPDLYTEWRLTW